MEEEFRMFRLLILYESMEEKIKLKIKNFFGSKLGRPEILNRFGDNLKKLRNISFEYDATFVKGFLEVCVNDNLEMGLRGIVNRIEIFIKNGLQTLWFKQKRLTTAPSKQKCKTTK